MTDIPVYYELNSVTVDGDAVSSLSEPVKGTIVAKNTSHVEFNNNYKPLGNLKVTKSVEASANSILPPPEGDTFSFTFTPSIEGEYKWEKFDKNGVEIGTGGTIKSGKTFQLESEQSFVVYGLPAGEACTITEVAVDNYEVEGGAGKSVTIVKDDTVEVSFKNIYTAPTGDLMITKTVINQSGSEIPASISNEFAFTFVLTDGTKPITQSFGYTISGTGSVVEDTGNIGKISNGNTIRLQGGASILIADLPAGAMYTVIETIPDDFAFSVNKAENTGTIESKKTVQVGVVNTYPAEKVGSLTITKELAEGTTCEADQTFLFKVTGPDEFEMDVVIRGTGSVKIDDLPLGEYTVTEDVKWSWRYELASGSASQTVELSTSQTEATTTFTNKLKDGGEKWLSGTAYADNNYTGNFNGTGSSTSSGTTSYVPSIFAISVTTTKGAAGNDEEE